VAPSSEDLLEHHFEVDNGATSEQGKKSYAEACSGKTLGLEEDT
jgi:hypothetical protein